MLKLLYEKIYKDYYFYSTMVTLIKDSDTDKLVPACSIQIPKTDRARLNKIKGDNDLKTFSDAVKYLLDIYDKK